MGGGGGGGVPGGSVAPRRDPTLPFSESAEGSLIGGIFLKFGEVEIKELCEIIGSKARKEALSRLLADRRNRVSEIDGLAGSAAAMLFTQLPKGKEPYLIIANDLDEAGYAYHDL